MGAFVNLIRKKLGLEPKRDKTLTGKLPNEVLIHRPLQETTKGNPVVFAPARMNPPTAAHRLIIDTALQAAREHDAPHHIILTRTHDVVKKKTGAGIRNPLTPEQKLKHARRFFPDANVQLADKDKPNLLSQLSDLHARGHDHVIMVAGSDRIPDYKRLIDGYNGKSGPHGYFNFKKVSFRSAGERDPDAEGPAGWSATKSRQTAEAGDYKTFKKNAVPGHLHDLHTRELFDDLRGGMGINEDVGFNMAGNPVPAIPTKSARDIQGRKSPLTDTPPPGKKGNIGYDSDLDDGSEKTRTQLSRRRSQKRWAAVQAFEGTDSISGDLDQGPTAYPVTTTPVPTAKPRIKSFKGSMKEGLFSDTNVPGEAGSPNYGSDVNNSSDSTTLRITKKPKRIKETACWKDYKQIGMKKGRKGNMVPNCVPKEEVELDEMSPEAMIAYRRSAEKDVVTHRDPKRQEKRLKGFDLATHKYLGTSKAKVSARMESIDQKDIRGENDEDASYRGDLLKRGTRVILRKPGYEGTKGNIDHYDRNSRSYVVSIDASGSNMIVKADELMALQNPDDKPMQESKNKPYVKPHYGDSSKPTVQTGWKASNKHGKVKYFGLDFKKSAKRHAGVLDEGIRHSYRAGLSDSTAKARESHWKNMSKYSDRDRRAYEPAPGDATAKTKLSKYTKAYHAKFGEEIELDETADAGLAAKAKKSGISIGTLRKVYRRGVAAWNSGHRPGTTPQQWGMARVNSYITKGKTYHTADKDLHEGSLLEQVKAIMERGEDSKGLYRSTESGAGLTRKGAKHFGIKTAVTTPPSKLKKGGTAWKRRKSFCARMGGMKGPMKDEKGRPTRKAMSLRRWNCEETEGDNL